MQFDAKAEQQKFWKIFDKKLIESGAPFSVLHEKAGETTYWAIVNKNNILVDNGLSLDFLVREKKIRINIYIRNNLPFFSFLEANKQAIAAKVRVPLNWVKGTRNANTRRISYETPVDIGNVKNYEDTIANILPIIIEIKTVCEIYGKNIFFDF